jgi:hypothetical protein
MKASPTERPDIRVPPPGNPARAASSPTRPAGPNCPVSLVKFGFPPLELTKKSANRLRDTPGSKESPSDPAPLKRTRRSWVGPALFMSQGGNSASFPFVIIEKANSAGQSGLGDCGRGVTRGNIRLSW